MRHGLPRDEVGTGTRLAAKSAGRADDKHTSGLDRGPSRSSDSVHARETLAKLPGSPGRHGARAGGQSLHGGAACLPDSGAAAGGQIPKIARELGSTYRHDLGSPPCWTGTPPG